jgi:hypothetical protein
MDSMERPPELLKSFANRLAQVVCSRDGTEMMRLLRQTDLLAVKGNLDAVPAGQDDKFTAHREGVSRRAPEFVGIWERKIENGETSFIRRKEMAKDWGFWANTGKIPPKTGKKRVVLIGESVARGFLYDPQFTPAMALEKVLRSRLGQEAVEVIDLARTNLSFEVVDLAKSALLLEPDVVIMFCGNNWDPGPPGATDLPVVGSTLREQGIPGLKHLGELKLAGRVTALVEEIAAAYKTANVPLVWIIPEFNLGDWRDPATNAPCMTEGLNERWIGLRRDAEAALESGDLEAASVLAGQMAGLDQGTCVTGLHILAECSLRKGDLQTARHCLELARDAVIWDTSKNAAPRTYSVAEKTLRQEVRRHSHEMVDLPQLFREHLKGEIPDRRLFVDYCHLSSEGILVAMAAAASSVIRIFNGTEVPWPGLMDPSVLPSRQIESESAFLSAIHNAHWWQSYELVHHYCVRAAQSGTVARLMASFVDIQTRRTPMLMCRATEQIAGMGSALMQHYLLRFNFQRLDRVLLGAIVAALRQVGDDLGQQLQDLRREEHSIARGNVNLLDYYYSSEGHQQEVMWVVPHLNDYLNHKINHYFKAYNHESTFFFVGEAGQPAHLQLSCRLPGYELAEGLISLKINDKVIGEIKITREWQTSDLTVPGRAILEGLNKVVLVWPTPVFPGLKPLELVVGDLMEGLYPEFFCVFGEIHSFVASSPTSRKNWGAAVPEELSAIGAL